MIQCCFHSDDDESDGGTPWWAGRGNFSHPGVKPGDELGKEDGSDVSSNQQHPHRKKVALFTEYSMTSSIVPRSEGIGIMEIVCGFLSESNFVIFFFSFNFAG